MISHASNGYAALTAADVRGVALLAVGGLGKCTLRPRPDIATRLFYVCHKCGLPVADTAVAFPEDANG